MSIFLKHSGHGCLIWNITLSPNIIFSLNEWKVLFEFISGCSDILLLLLLLLLLFFFFKNLFTKEKIYELGVILYFNKISYKVNILSISRNLNKALNKFSNKSISWFVALSNIFINSKNFLSFSEASKYQ